MIQHTKNLFNLKNDVHYLNCAYLSPLLNSVELVGKSEMEKRRNPFEYTLEDFFQPMKDLKGHFASLIHETEEDRIAIIPSVSYGLANAAKNVRPKKKGQVLVLEGQFPSNYYVWKRYCDVHQQRMKIVATPDVHGDWTKQLLEAINEKTTAVAIPPLHWADGSRIDLEKVGAKCREVEAYFIIDGTQLIGADTFNNLKIQADAIICAGYKWLMGPYGMGLAYYGPKFDDGIAIEENWVAKVKSDEFSDLVDYQTEDRPKAWKYSMGESSNFIYVKMLIEALKQIKVWGPENIQSHCLSITEPMVDEFRDLGCLIEAKDKRYSHLFGIQPPAAIDINVWHAHLIDQKIYTSVRGKCIRVAPHLYNDVEDFALMLENLKSLL